MYTLTLYDVHKHGRPTCWTLAPAGAVRTAALREGPTPRDTPLTLPAFGTASSTIKLGLGAKEIVNNIDVASAFDTHWPR